MKTIQVYRLNERATLPTRAHSTDAALDLYALEDIAIPLGSTCLVKTGIAANIQPGYVGLLRERSSIGKRGFKVAGGVIDAGYSGDISVLLMNVSHKEPYQVKAGDRIAQLLIVPIATPEVEEVFELWSSERGHKGFGSSGA